MVGLVDHAAVGFVAEDSTGQLGEHGLEFGLLVR